MIECINLSKFFSDRAGKVSAIKNVNLNISEHEFVCIVGPSGCGKTTILKLLAGLLQPSSGEIRFSSNNKNNQIKSALIFQEQGLFPWMNVLDNIAFGLEAYGINKKERYAQARAWVKKMGLLGFENYYPEKISGGMRQRVALARAFLSDPEILLMDEPFGSLDAQTKKILQQELIDIWREEKKTVIFITHDIEEAILLGDRILVMTGQPGKIREEIIVNLKRPRNLASLENEEVSRMKLRIWQLLEEEVRQNI